MPDVQDEDSKLKQLVRLAKGSAAASIHVDFGVRDGPLAELSALLSDINGFTLFDGGVQVFHAGAATPPQDGDDHGPELLSWNAAETWKDAYGGLADDVFCFGQDLFGVQYGIVDNEAVVTLDPETGETDIIGHDLETWAAWLLEDTDANGAASFAQAYQAEQGVLTPSQRLVPLQFFVTGGSYDYENLVAKDAAEAMRIRGPIAQQISQLPDGAEIVLTTGEVDGSSSGATS